MAFIHINTLKRQAKSKHYRLILKSFKRQDGVRQIGWALEQSGKAYLFDTPWEVAEGLAWLDEKPVEAQQLLRTVAGGHHQRRAAAVVQDSNTARVTMG